MCRWSTSTFDNSCWWTALDMQSEGKRLSRQTGGQSNPHVACFLKDLKCWEAWDTTCGQKAKDITPSMAWRREALKEEVLDDLPWKGERGPSSIRWTFEPFQRQRWENDWETGGAHMTFSERINTILNWTELNQLTKFTVTGTQSA